MEYISKEEGRKREILNSRENRLSSGGGGGGAQNWREDKFAQISIF